MAKPVSLQDGQVGFDSFVSPFGSLRTANLTHLIGSTIFGGTIDPRFWTVTTANGGTVTATEAIANLRTNTAANGSSQIVSQSVSRFLTGNENIYTAGVRLGDTGVSNNIRRWGAFNANNGVFFELNGTELRAVHRNSGIDTALAQASFTGAQPVIDTNFHVYDIVYSSGSAFFFQDKIFLTRIRSLQSSIIDAMALPIGYQNTNINGATIDTQLFIRGSSISRFGKEFSTPTYYHSGSAETVTLKSRAGQLHRVIMNKRGAGQSTLTLYDSTTAAGSVIAVIDVVNTAGAVLEYGLVFQNGLTIVHTTTAGDLTIIYD